MSTVLLCTFKDSAVYKEIISTIRVNTKLEELTLDEIESEMVVEARDFDFRTSNHPRESCWIMYPYKGSKKKTGGFSEKKGYKKHAHKSKSADTAMHQVYSVMAKAGQEEQILESGASAHMTRIKSLLKDYKELQPLPRPLQMEIL